MTTFKAACQDIRSIEHEMIESIKGVKGREYAMLVRVVVATFIVGQTLDRLCPPLIASLADSTLKRLIHDLMTDIGIPEDGEARSKVADDTLMIIKACGLRADAALRDRP